MLRVDTAFFAALGIATLGELLALPRDGLASRCGQRLIAELDQALGRLLDPREFFVPPERFSASLDLPAEVTHAEALLFAARRLLAQLCGLLAARSRATQYRYYDIEDAAGRLIEISSRKREQAAAPLPNP